MNVVKSETGKTIVLVIITAIIAFMMMWINTYQRCRKEYLKGEEFIQKKEYIQAITSYETALHAYTPFNNMIALSANRLWEIALDREHNNDLDMALIALRSLRSSFFAVRSLYQPYPEWIKRAEERIDEIVKRQAKEKQINKNKPDDAPAEQ